MWANKLPVFRLKVLQFIRFWVCNYYLFVSRFGLHRDANKTETWWDKNLFAARSGTKHKMRAKERHKEMTEYLQNNRNIFPEQKLSRVKKQYKILTRHLHHFLPSPSSPLPARRESGLLDSLSGLWVPPCGRRLGRDRRVGKGLCPQIRTVLFSFTSTTLLHFFYKFASNYLKTTQDLQWQNTIYGY